MTVADSPRPTSSRTSFRFSFPTIALAIISAPNLASGQSEEIAEAAQGAAQSIDVDEEVVIVTGRRNLNVLIQEGATLTEDFYMRLNEVIDEPDFQIACDAESRAGTRIRHRVCRTNFQRRLNSRQSASILQSVDRGSTLLEDFAAESLARAAEFQAAVLDAVNSDPILNQQFHRLRDLKIAIEDYRMGLDRSDREAE